MMLTSKKESADQSMNDWPFLSTAMKSNKEGLERNRQVTRSQRWIVIVVFR